MNTNNYFPLGKAHGLAFCNRTTETDWLINLIQTAKHSLLIAPRRFGKSSLAERAITLSKLPHVTLNFNTCTDEYDIEALIRQGTGELIGTALGPLDKLLSSIKNYAKNLTPKISIGPDILHLELSPVEQTNPIQRVEESLRLLEKLLAEKKQHAVMLFDEFQLIGIIAKGSGVEAAIRNMAQDMKYLAIIFSGSNRRLLKTMFEDEGRPLYKLCRKLALKRIEAPHYAAHLNQAARAQWHKTLPEEIISKILHLSERHPYYINYLCDVIWTSCLKQIPTQNDVEAAWACVLEEEESDANAELALLSLGQKKVLKYIANYPNAKLLSGQALQGLGMPLSSITTAIHTLLEKDIIEKEAGYFRIINPIIKTILLAKPPFFDS